MGEPSCPFKCRTLLTYQKSKTEASPSIHIKTDKAAYTPCEMNTVHLVSDLLHKDLNAT